MGVSNQQVIKRAGALTTDDVGSTFTLPLEQANKFLEKVRDTGPTLPLIRQETMNAASKAINRLFINRRVLRKGTENTAPTVGKPFSFDQITLNASLMKAAYELTRQTKRDTLAKAAFERQTVGLMAAHIGLDMNDLLWNGDVTDWSAASTTMNDAGGINASDVTVTLTDSTGFPAASSGFGYLVIENERITYTANATNVLSGLVRGADDTTAAIHSDTTAVTFIQDDLFPVYDGVLVQVTAGGTVVDGTTINGGDIHYDHFEAMMDGVPAKYRQKMGDNFRWFVNDRTRRRWTRFLTARATNLGDMSIYSEDKNGPHGINFHVDEFLPDGVIVYGPLKGMVHGMRADNIKVARTSEGKDLVSRSATYYQWEIEADVVLEEGEMFARCNSLTTSLT